MRMYPREVLELLAHRGCLSCSMALLIGLFACPQAGCFRTPPFSMDTRRFKSNSTVHVLYTGSNTVESVTVFQHRHGYGVALDSDRFELRNLKGMLKDAGFDDDVSVSLWVYGFTEPCVIQELLWEAWEARLYEVRVYRRRAPVPGAFPAPDDWFLPREGSHVVEPSSSPQEQLPLPPRRPSGRQ